MIGFTLICHSIVWSIWKVYNDLFFAGMLINVDQLVERIQFQSWKWFFHKHLRQRCSFYEWQVELICALVVWVVPILMCYFVRCRGPSFSVCFWFFSVVFMVLSSVFFLLARDLFSLLFCCLVCWWPSVVVVFEAFWVIGVLMFCYYLSLKKN